MIDFKFRPETYFQEDSNSVLLVRLHYPESQWGEQISIYAHWIEQMIHLEVVDFYGTEYLLYPSRVEEPMDLEELIYLIEGMQVNQDALQGKMALVLDGVPEADSALYPDLRNYFMEKRLHLGL